MIIFLTRSLDSPTEPLSHIRYTLIRVPAYPLRGYARLKVVGSSRGFACATLCTLVLLAGASCTRVDADSGRTVAPSIAGSRYRSMTYSSRRPPEPGTLEQLKDLGVSHVTLIPFGYQEAFDSPSIRFDPDRRWFSESDSGITDLARRARALGMGTILKPHIWVGHYSIHGQQRNQIGFGSEDSWYSWEQDYRRFILHYADLASRIDADIFVVGTELATAALRRPDYWRALVREVRDRYHGKLTYAANWYQEYSNIAFWPDLDLVGVQAYFPLSDSPDVSESDLRRGWTRHLEALAALSRDTGRPVFFTEIGYRSVRESPVEPWRWASRQEAQLSRPDAAVQAILYRAFFAEVWNRPWFAGASFWRWHTESESVGPLRAIDFTPQHKPALDILRDGFRTAAP